VQPWPSTHDGDGHRGGPKHAPTAHETLQLQELVQSTVPAQLSSPVHCAEHAPVPQVIGPVHAFGPLHTKLHVCELQSVNAPHAWSPAHRTVQLAALPQSTIPPHEESPPHSIVQLAACPQLVENGQESVCKHSRRHATFGGQVQIGPLHVI
jgi:hypothetical protein